jgi:GntR family transcriptional regulator
MQRARQKSIPAYQRIQQEILRQIESGNLKPGDAVSSERELARKHGVSLMTARHGLTALEREGVVVRRPGAGTFVQPPKIHFNKLASFTEEMAARGLSARSKVLSYAMTDNEQEAAARLALTSGQRLIKVERLRLGAGEPFALETCYLPADGFSGLSRDALERGSLFSILKYDHGLELSYSDEEIDSTMPDPQTARLLNLRKGAPLLRIRQVIYSTKGRPTVYVLGFYRSDRYRLMIRRYR